MGGWGAALGGAVSGIGQYAHEQNLLQLQQNAAQKDALMKFYQGIMDNPNLEHMAPEAAQAFLHISTTPLDNKWGSNVAKFTKQYDPQVMNETALTRHASQHPGAQEASQLQLPPGLVPPKVSGVPGEQAGAADGAAHQFAMQQQTPPQQQQGQQGGQQGITPSPMQAIEPIPNAVPGMAHVEPIPNATPGMLGPRTGAQAQGVGMLAATTGAMNGNLPNPSPIPQVSPSPAQASAAAGVSVPPIAQQQGRPVVDELLGWGHPHSERLKQEMQIHAAEDWDKAQASVQQQQGLRRDTEAVKKAWLADPATQKALSERDFMTLGITAPPGVTIPNMSAMMTPRLLASNVSGAEAAPGTLDNNGHPIDPDKHYTKRSANGQVLWEPTDVRQKFDWIKDPANPQQMVLAQLNPYSGDMEIVPDAAKLNPAMIPQVSTNNSVRIVPQADGSLAAVPVTSTTTKTRPAPGATASTAVTPPPTAQKSTLTPATGPRVVGQTAQRTKMEMDNPLDAAGRNLMSDIDPRLKMITRLKNVIKQNGWDKQDTPMTTFLPRVAYAMGFGNDTSNFLSQLELGRVTQAAGVMKGSSRAIAALNKAMIHTPDAWKDSGRLMLDKLTGIEQNLKDIETSAKDFHQQHPGLTRSPAETSGSDSGGVTELERGPDGKLRIKGQ